MIKLCAFADEAGNLLEEQIKALNENKIRYIELRNVNNKNVMDLTLDEAAQIKIEFDKHAIDVWSVGSPIGKVDINTDFEKYLQKAEHIFSLANIFESENVRIFSFFKAYDKNEKVFEYLNKLCDIAKKYKVKLCHENEKEVYGDVLQRVEEIISNVPDLKFIYDPANYIQCKQDVKEAFKKLKDKTYYYHLKDALYENGAVVPCGAGDGNIKEIINSLENEKVLSIEPHLALFKGYSLIDNTELKNTIKFENNRQSFDYAVNSVKQLLLENGYHQQDNGDFVK